MFSSRVSSTLLNAKRLDADFYRPDYLEIEEKLKSLPVGKLGDVGHFFAGPFGSLLPSNLYLEEGVPLFRVGNVGQFEVLPDNFAHLAPEVHADLKASEVCPGDLLVVKASVGEKICKVPEWIPRANITQHIIGIRPNQTYDTDYVAAFLFSKFGVSQLQRYSLGSIIQYLGIGDAKGTYIVNASAPVQRYIGEKIRQAERLRAWARTIEIAVNRFHLGLIPTQDSLDFSSRIRRVNQARMAERMDAHFYPGVVDQYLRIHHGKFCSLGGLCTDVFNGQTQPETIEGESTLQVTVTNLSPSFLVGKPRTVVDPNSAAKYLKQHDVLICNAAHNKSYIGRDLTYVHSEAPLLPSTEVMTIRVDRSQVPASYVRSYLLTKLGFIQIQSTVRGITAHSYPGDMRQIEIYVPEIASELRMDWFACDGLLAMAGTACELATRLTSAAIHFVEGLIEGHVNETTLIEAQQVLSIENDQLDRALLARLKTDGIDGKGPALFPDIEQLHKLLAQAQDSV